MSRQEKANEQREQQMMTSAEAYAAEIYKDEPDNFHTDEQLCETINDFCAGWRAADNSRWIPVEEELPKCNIIDCGLATYPVLVYREDGFIDISHYDSEEGKWDCVSVVTHWMPLPKPPQRKEE